MIVDFYWVMEYGRELELHDSKWIFLDEHLDRLFEASKATGIDIGMDRAGIVSALEKTRIANKMTGDVHARLMLTREKK